MVGSSRPGGGGYLNPGVIVATRKRIETRHEILHVGGAFLSNVRKILAPVIDLGSAVAGRTRPVPPTHSSLSDDNLQASGSLGKVVDDGVDDSDADDSVCSRYSMDRLDCNRTTTIGDNTNLKQ